MDRAPHSRDTTRDSRPATAPSRSEKAQPSAAPTEKDAGQSLESKPVLITGMSGAGLNTAARVLEDLGYHVAQNLPPAMVLEFVDLCLREDSPVRKFAVVTDVRSREFTGSLDQTIAELSERGHNPTVLFMESRDDVLIRRFDSVRRTHPLQGSSTLQTGIERERAVLSAVKEQADVVIDTSEMSVHDLRRSIESSFATLRRRRQHMTVQSFGFKHGAPADADIVVDVRFLPNPYWVPELRPFRGTDQAVSDYVLSQPGAEEFITSFLAMLTPMTTGYRREGKNFISVAVGCTGGHHRSVAVAEELARRIRQSFSDVDVSVAHRDFNRN
ncbi:RNase adapter RapZ [Corynebacterium ciconiae]|uniref:RNase adapter RapZ n=1 Tax=Corynebacterium ciconiae TaxID=227319 RepID=UPI000378FAEF